MQNSTAGYASIASLVVLALSHYGIVIPQSEVLDAILGTISLVTIIKQVIDHKKLANVARSAGAIK